MKRERSRVRIPIILLSAFVCCAVAVFGQSNSPVVKKVAAPDPSLAAVIEDPRLPRVLLIGDSISMGYTVPVRRLLEGKANVYRIPENGGPTTNGLAKLDAWLGKTNWDVIHFNFGLHDLKLITAGRRRIPVEDYESNLREIVRRLKRTKARLIWANTTPVPPPAAKLARVTEDVPIYNAAAARVMKQNHIPTDDLYRLALPLLGKIQRPQNVHYTDEGYSVLATQVASVIQAALPATRERTQAWMPGKEDYTEMWWANGPHQFRVPNAPTPEPILCLQSGRLGLVIDTQKLKILHAGKFHKRVDADSGFRRGDADLFSLPMVPLELSVVHEGHLYTCRGRGALNKDAFYFPVRFIESGRFLQRVAIEDLEFADNAGASLPQKGRLEISLWPDRITLAFSLETENPTNQLSLVAGELSVSGNSPVLELCAIAHHQRPRLSVETPLQAAYDEGLGCFVVKLPASEWQKDKDAYYPRSELDRLDKWRFTLSNPYDKDTTVPIMFVDEHPPAITGFTPILCDRDGTPTGIPIQISKNWHQRKEKGDLPHQGPWFHGCAYVHAPPKGEREFTLAIAYARYGGIPAASHAQLSLIGWGINQFWDESALGSFGESICYEPGRIQRRCFIDDVRPFMTLTDSAAKPFGWAGNAGGGDFLMWVDAQGSYQGFRRTRADYQAYGPCLTDVRYREETVRGEIESAISVSVARSDDYLRAFYHIRYDVRRPVQWQRLAFFQLGADFYNDTPSRHAAIGNDAGLIEAWNWPETNSAARLVKALRGPNSWISFHGVDREQVGKGGAIATRGLIVRSWKAVLNGQRCSQPCVSFFATESGHKICPAAEIIPPPDIAQLRRGDFVEADLEMVVFPADASAYYGPNQRFRKSLEQDADTWRLVHGEAAGNALDVAVQKGKLERKLPLALGVDSRDRASCVITGGLGYLPVTFNGLHDYRGFELVVDGIPLNQTVHGNDFWQTDYDPQSCKWRITYNIPRERPGSSRLELRRINHK